MNNLFVHQTATDSEIRYLSSQKLAKEYDRIVFRSYYQLETFRRTLGLDYDNLTVIETGVAPYPSFTRDFKSNVNLVYTMPAHHGLHILMPVFNSLREKYNNKITLDILDDFKYEPLQDKLDKLKRECEETENVQIHNHGSAHHLNEHGDVWVYPTIWENADCLMMKAAMSAGLICVHPAYGVLPEISGGLTVQYDMTTDNDAQASNLYQVLDVVVNAFLDKESFNILQARSKFIKAYADMRYDAKIEQSRLNMLKQENYSEEV